MYVEYNPNPAGRSVGDCAVRAVAKALDVDWESAYAMISLNGFLMSDMPSSNATWGATLKQNGFYMKSVPNNYPQDYTAKDFCCEHKNGVYVLGFGNHVATAIDGKLFDSWDSSNEILMYVWYKKENTPFIGDDT